ncbi:MAG: 2-oxoacid:acceptor oxidoreductase family protein [Jatrophihabitantaceae bacterium]
MLAIRIHGRGGQGVVTMAELLAAAAFDSGHEVQAFPSFGSERMGAPVTSFCRVGTSPIVIRDPITEPDVVIICDATLLHHVDVFSGLSATGMVLLNSEHTPSQLGLGELVERLAGAGLVVTVPATEIARRHTGRTLPSGPLLGACAALLPEFAISSVDWAIRSRFGRKVADGNVAAAGESFELVREPDAVPHA